MKKTTAPEMSAKPTTPPTTPPAIAPANVLLLCEPLPGPKEGVTVLSDAELEIVTVSVAELEIVTVGTIVDGALDSGVSMTNFQIRRVGMFERLTSICQSNSCVECIGDRHIQECPVGNSCFRWYACYISGQSGENTHTWRH